MEAYLDFSIWWLLETAAAKKAPQGAFFYFKLRIIS